MAGFGIIMPIGPGDREIARAADVLEGLFAYESKCAWVVLIDDVKAGRQLESSFPCPPGCKYQVFINPRNGKGNGWSGGMCVGVATAVRWLARETEVAFAIRLDTDSLVIAPFAEKVNSFLRDFPQVGLAGSYSRYPCGAPRRLDIWAPMIEPYTFRFRLYKNRFGLPLHPRMALFGRARRRRLFLRRALDNGYQPGEFCSGGGYAVSRTLMDRLANDSDFADPCLFRDTRITEDNMMAIACRAVGLKLADFNHDGEPFAVTGVTLTDEPSRLLARGYSIIHPIKNAAGWEEEKIRSLFRTMRKNCEISDGED